MTKRKKDKMTSYGLRNTTKNYRFNNTNHFKKTDDELRCLGGVSSSYPTG